MISEYQARAEHGSQSGKPEDYIPVAGFVSDQVFITSAGETGMVLEIQGAAYECLAPEDLRAHALRFEQALRPFDTGFRLYQYVLKRNGAEIPSRGGYASPLAEMAVSERTRQLASCSTISAYIVILFSRFRNPATAWERLKRRLFAGFSERLTGESIEEQMYFASEELVRNVESLAAQMAGHMPMRILDKHGMFLFFRRLLNFDPQMADMFRLKRDTGLARQLTDTPIDVDAANQIRAGSHFVRVLTLKDPPEETAANLLRPLIEAKEAQCVIVTEWRPEPARSVTKLIKTMKNHLLIISNVRVMQSVLQALTDKGEKADPEPGHAQKTAAQRLDEAQSAMLNDGVQFGRCSLTVVMYDLQQARLAHTVSRIQKALGELGVTFYQETLGCLWNYFATIPGNSRYNFRYLWLSGRNYSHLAFLFLPQSGDQRNEYLNDEYLVALQTRQNTPHFLSMHYGGVGHSFIDGATGSGKSFLMNLLITHAQKYDPWTLIIDKGGSYRQITEQFGGSYLNMDPARMRVKINPFCLPEDDANINFLHSFVRLLIESGGYKLTDEDSADLFQRVAGMYRMEPQDRTLGMLYATLRSNLKPRLARWVRQDERQRPGQFGAIFDNATDTLTLARFQTLDFQGMSDQPEIVEPLMFYVLRRSEAVVYDPALAHEPKLVITDETWQLLTTDITRDYIVSALKTWRKYKGSCWFVTQSLEDLLAENIQRILTETPTTISLASPKMNADAYRQLLGYNDTEIALVKGMQPKRDLLIKTPGYAQVCQFIPSGAEAALYSSTPQTELEETRKTA